MLNYFEEKNETSFTKKNRIFRSIKNRIFLKGLTHAFWPKNATFFLFRFVQNKTRSNAF